MANPGQRENRTRPTPMMKFLRKNNKKILAVFTAMLMIAFIADAGYRRYNAPESSANIVVGKVGGDTDLHASDVAIAENELRILANNALVQTNSREPGRQFVSLLEDARLPQAVVSEWFERPLTFALLK